MALRIIRTIFFFSTVQVIYTVLYYTILYYFIQYYTILYYSTYISILHTVNIVYIYIVYAPHPQYLTRVDIETIR